MKPRTSGRYLVADRSLPSLDVAMSYAQTVATRRQEPATLYVRALGEEGAKAIVTRDDKGVVHTRRVG